MRLYIDHDLRIDLVAHKLASWRAKARLTQREVATALGYTTPQFISNWERGVSLPPKEALPTLARLYNIKPRVIIDLVYKYRAAEVKAEHQAMLGRVMRMGA